MQQNYAAKLQIEKQEVEILGTDRYGCLERSSQ